MQKLAGRNSGALLRHARLFSKPPESHKAKEARKSPMSRKEPTRRVPAAGCTRGPFLPTMRAVRSMRPGLPTRRHLGAAAAVLGFALQDAHAAGGHHAVDDAAILEPGQCQVETWADRERGGGRTLVHLGSACRIGPLELGLNLDRTRWSGSDAAVSGGPQVKWAAPLTESLSVGVVVSAAWQDPRPQFAGSTVVLPLTWQPTESLAVQVNLGRDFRRHGPDVARQGAALEWTATPHWSLVAERFRESEAGFWRLGARYAVTDALSVDLSQARGVTGGAPAWWTVGLNWAFQR